AGLDYIGWFRMDTCADCPKYCKVPLTEIPSCYTSDCDCDDGTPAGTTTYTACDPGDETQGWPWPDDLTYFETYYAYQDFVTRVVDDDLQPAPLEVDGAVWRYHFQPPGDPLAENIYFWIQGKSLSNITIDAPNDPNVYGFRVYDMFGNQVQAGFLQNGQAIMPPSGNPRRLIWKYFGAQHPFLSAVDPDGVIEAGHSVLSLVSTEAAGRIDSNVEDRALVSAEVDAQGRLNLRIAGFEHEEIYLDRVSISPIAPTQDEVSLDAALTSTGEPVHDDVTGAHVEAFHSEPDAGALPLEFADGEFAVIRPGQFVDLQVATELAPGTEARVLVELEGHYHVLSDAEESSDTSTPVRLSVRPSPFRAETTIALQASHSSPVDVVVYGVDGRRVRVFRNVTVPALRWDGRDTRGQDVAPGVYFVRAHSGEATSTVRAVKLR
ncbi:MAG TPA: hypothetical protein VKU85_04760, partial [bacterium]|nr:hypothetical protein [bacterium]